MLFVRIVDAGLTRNGNSKRKVYVYKPEPWKKEQYNYASVETLKSLDFGSVYKEKHFILTQWEKHQILKRLDETIGKDNYLYIFE
jgi:hypothetical protein